MTYIWENLDDEEVMYHFRIDSVPKSKLNYAIASYNEKIPLIQQNLNKLLNYPDAFKWELIEENPDISENQLKSLLNEEIEFLQSKKSRILAKQRGIQYKFDELKKGRSFDEHSTTYYIDLDNGDDSNDGLSTSNAWKTIQQYTTNTVRSPGDIAYVRANTTQTLSSDINFDEDGNADNPIKIIGCDSTNNDPWNDNSDAKPTIDCNSANGSYQVKLYMDNYWHLERLEMKDSSDYNGIFYIYGSHPSWIIDCDIHNHSDNTSGKGIYTNYYSVVNVQSSSLYSNGAINIYLYNSSLLHLSNSNLNGGAGTTNYGVYINYAKAYIFNTDFADSSAHDSYDIYATNASPVYLVNCYLGTSTPIYVFEWTSWVRCQNYNNSSDDNRSWYYMGTVKSDTSVVRTGGSDVSALVEPNSYCNSAYPLTLTGGLIDTSFFPNFSIRCNAQQTTVTVYIRSKGAWSSYPTADELYIQTRYWNGSDYVLSNKSTQTLNDDTTWVGFTNTFTPAAESWAYVDVFLKKYESGKGVYVDLKPVVS